MEMINFPITKQGYLYLFCVDKGLKGPIVNRAFNSFKGESFEITYTNPFSQLKKNYL